MSHWLLWAILTWVSVSFFIGAILYFGGSIYRRIYEKKAREENNDRNH